MSAPPQVLLCTYDVLPGPTGTSRRLSAYVKALSDRFEVSILSIKTPELSHIERFHGARLLRVPVGSGDLESRIQAFDRAVRRQLSSEDYALVHVAGPFGGYAACEERSRHGYRLIYEGLRFPSQELSYFHPELEGDRRFLSRVRRQELFCLMNADRVVTGSGPTQAFVRALGVARENVKVVRSPAELSLYKDPFPPPGHATARALYLGNQAPYQGLPTLLRAIARCTDPVELIVAGPRHSDWEPQLRELARELGVSERVEFQPLTTSARLTELLADSDLGVIPLEDCERNRLQGGPLAKASEYLAAGRPVIASDLPVTRDLLPTDATIFVPPGEVEGWAAALSELSRDAPRRVALGHEGRAFAASYLDPVAIGRSISALYVELLTGRTHRARHKSGERKLRGPQEETLVRPLPEELRHSDTDKTAVPLEVPAEKVAAQAQLPVSARLTLENPQVVAPKLDLAPPPPGFVPPPPGSRIIPAGIPRSAAPLPSILPAPVKTEIGAGFVPPPAEAEETTSVTAPLEAEPEPEPEPEPEEVSEDDFTETTYVPIAPEREASPWQQEDTQRSSPRRVAGREKPERTQIVSTAELGSDEAWSAQPLRKVGIAIGLRPSEPPSARTEIEMPQVSVAKHGAEPSSGAQAAAPSGASPHATGPASAATQATRSASTAAATSPATHSARPATAATDSAAPTTTPAAPRVPSGRASAPNAASLQAPSGASPPTPPRDLPPPSAPTPAVSPAIPRAPAALPITRPRTAPELAIPSLARNDGPEEIDSDEVMEADDIAEPIDDPDEIAALSAERVREDARASDEGDSAGGAPGAASPLPAPSSTRPPIPAAGMPTAARSASPAISPSAMPTTAPPTGPAITPSAGVPAAPTASPAITPSAAVHTAPPAAPAITPSAGVHAAGGRPPALPQTPSRPTVPIGGGTGSWPRGDPSPLGRTAMMPPVLFPASARPTVTPAATRAAHVLPEIDADAIAELAPPPSLPEGTLEPWLAQVLHGYCPPESTLFQRPPPPTTFPGRDERRPPAPPAADPASPPAPKA